MRLLRLLFLLLGGRAFGQGHFSYVSHHLPLSIDQGQYFDLNDDGLQDFSVGFRSVVGHDSGVVSYFEGQLLNGPRIVTESFYFANASVLAEGQLLDSVAIPVRTDMEPPAAGAGPYNWLGDIRVTGFSLGGNNGYGSSGIFVEGESVFGIQLLEADGYHNGWLRFENKGSGPDAGIRLTDWGYNLDPNEPILAGMLQVPEPRTWMMMVLGLVVFVGARKRVCS
jgi:hypothetical protein